MDEVSVIIRRAGFAVVGAARRHARAHGRDIDVLFFERFPTEG